MSRTCPAMQEKKSATRGSVMLAKGSKDKSCARLLQQLEVLDLRLPLLPRHSSFPRMASLMSSPCRRERSGKIQLSLRLKCKSNSFQAAKARHPIVVHTWVLSYIGQHFAPVYPLLSVQKQKTHKAGLTVPLFLPCLVRPTLHV